MRIPALALLLSASLFGATMHNGDVLRMVRKGAPVAQIVERINASESGFVLYPEDVNALKQDGVPEVVIRAMFARNANQQLQLTSPTGTHSVSEPATAMASPAVAAPNAHIANLAPTAARPEISDLEEWSLRPGRPEVIGRFGLNAGPSRSDFGFGTTSWAANTEVAVGIAPWLAGIGTYGFNGVGKLTDKGCLLGICYQASARVRFHEMTGGLRFSVPMRFSPYAVGVAGAVRLTEKDAASATGLGAASDHYSITKPAFGAGGGLNLGINRHLGTQVDFRILKVVDLPWYLRTTAGVYVRF